MLIINAQEKRNIKQSSELLAHCFTTLKTGNKSTSRALQKSMYKIQCCREMPNAQSKAITWGQNHFWSHIWLSLKSIPSHHLSSQFKLWAGKFAWGVQNIAGCCQQTLENKMFVDITHQCFVLLSQVNYPANNMNFHWRWRCWDQIQAIFLNLF